MSQKERIWRILRVRWPLLALGLLLAYLAPFYVLHIHSIASEWVINDDERQWTWAMLRYSDPGLFHNDYVFDYAMAFTPFGYKIIYWLGSMVIDAARLSKFVCYGLLLVTVLFTSLSAARLAGPVAGLASAALLLVGGFWLYVAAGGLPNSFAPAFGAVAMYLLVSHRPWLLALVTPIAASIYPPVSLVMGAALTIFFLLPSAWGGDSSESLTVRRRLLILCVSGFATLIILSVSISERAEFGSLIDPKNPTEIAAYPERLGNHDPARGDRSAEWTDVLMMPLNITAAAVDGGWHLVWAKSGIGRLFLAVIYGACILIIFNNRHRGHQICLLILPLAAVGTGLLATALYPKLYFPSRYLVSVALSFFAIFPVALALLTDRTSGQATTERRIVIGTLIFALVFGFKGPDAYVGYGPVDSSSRLMLSYLRTLPKNVLIAGWEPIDDVPLLSRRSILFSREMHTSFQTKYVLQMRQRTNALIDAYYATDPEPLRRLNKNFGVTHLLADRRHFDPKAAAPRYFPPFTKRIKELKRASANQTTIVEQLMDTPLSHDVTPDVSIIDLAQWTKENQDRQMRISQ